METLTSGENTLPLSIETESEANALHRLRRVEEEALLLPRDFETNPPLMVEVPLDTLSTTSRSCSRERSRSKR
jgi:hypothetical protein